MYLTFTDKAIEKIKVKMDESKGSLLKLKYETEGCGCVVSGVAALWIISGKDDEDIEVESNFGKVLMEQTKLVFFDEKMTIDIVESMNTFILKSSNQIFNPRMALSDKA